MFSEESFSPAALGLCGREAAESTGRKCQSAQGSSTLLGLRLQVLCGGSVSPWFRLSPDPTFMLGNYVRQQDGLCLFCSTGNFTLSYTPSPIFYFGIGSH